VLKQFKDCFEGVGCFQGEYHITVDPTIPSVVHPPRSVPEALRESMKKSLIHWLSKKSYQKLLSLLSGSTPLCASVRALVHCGFSSTLEDVVPKLNGAKCFSILMYIAVAGITSLPKRAHCLEDTDFYIFLSG